MAALKLLTFTTLFCLAHGWTDTWGSVQGPWKKMFSEDRNIFVKDGDNHPLVTGEANLAVFGDFNRTQYQNVISNFIAEKISFLEHEPEEAIQEVYVDGPLPLLFNMTVKELITLGPSPVKNIGVLLTVKVYGKKRKHHDAFSVLKSLKSSF